ncbi:universal stress protein [Halopenitus sp. POP-27]|uniref:universal stress protein n=1 Tax=Halopenitus sp. POP-27 TaxID=2994425 RepID=UPI002468C347|nr:universal stress protein [Halopenitus sp. POP-27]
MYDEILLPVAPDGDTSRAVPHVVALAERYDARIHVLAIVDTLEEAIGDPQLETLTERLETAAHDRVHEVRSELDERGIDADAHVHRGTPHEAIRTAVEDLDVDLVVMPTHSREGLERVLLGSVTERIIRQSPVPVLSVPME